MLDLACLHGHAECVETLLLQGDDILVHDSTTRRTPLHSAAMNGHTECLRLLMETAEDSNIVDCTDVYERTPLMMAVANGHVDTVLYLIANGAIVNAKDSQGRTALHRGAANGHEECVDALLHNGADVTVRDHRGRMPAYLAATCGQVCILSNLLAMGPSSSKSEDHLGYTPLHIACYNGQDNCVETILEQEKITELSGNPFSPLHCAV
ncbi:serine/threonine-protein phosphatase 6 regulatory ankyrin repeat subunit A-like, partial [Saccostrea cucullata]|uniref:serine/threonine-protein phosphatase 6 regulatory ankyrin repeat subunit A-like n=1 Tax=Saccostrea cuccullata TaxID=36930 RepID=UPI002ED01FE8